MMQVHLDVGDSGLRHIGERIQQIGVILFFGIEERISGRAADRVAMRGGNPRPAIEPALHPSVSQVSFGASPTRLKMIGERDPDSLTGAAVRAQQTTMHISWQP